MEMRQVRKLVNLVRASNLVEVEVKIGEGSIRVARSPERAMAPKPRKSAPAAVVAPVVAVEAVIADEAAPVPVHVVRSPMVGMSHTAPGPDQAPFVAIGQRVEIGATLILVEALKTIQSIEAPVAGVVREILIGNAQPIEFDQPLFVIG